MSGDKIPHMQIRQPATANLMVDSADRTSGTWGNFTIQKKNSILNGFFYRIGTTEIVLEWNEPNINEVVLGGVNQANVTVTVATVAYTVTIPTGFYTVEEAFASLVALLTVANVPGATWTFTQIDGLYTLGANVDFAVSDTPLARKLDIYQPAADGDPARIVTKPDLRPYRYLDFISSQLTYNQKLKDGSTALISNDVLARWYFAWDTPPTLDGNGFPILMGYTPFVVRRTFSPPKQIRWESNMPVGQILFQVYNPQGNLINSNDENNFLMTLQVSED